MRLGLPSQRNSAKNRSSGEREFRRPHDRDVAVSAATAYNFGTAGMSMPPHGEEPAEQRDQKGREVLAVPVKCDDRYPAKKQNAARDPDERRTNEVR